MSNPVTDAGIPLLTEIIDPHHANIPHDHPPSLPPKLKTPAPHVDEPSVTAEAPAIDGWIDDEWTRLERKVSERVLQQLVSRIDFVLEQRVRDSLADVLQTAVEGLALEIKQGLQETLEEVIARAVTQEINRMQTTKK